MDQSHEAGNMSEAERGGQTGLDRATSGLATELVLTTADAQGLPNPDHVVVALELRIHAVERRVRRNHAGLEQLRQTVDLEDAGTTLGVAGKRLLRDHEQRVAIGAADAWASVLCSSDSFGSLALVDVSCLETTAMSSLRRRA